jgi:hypothetical protein
MSIEDQFAMLKSQLATAEEEYGALKAGKKSSAPRLRKSLMNLKNQSHAMRASTTAYVRELPTKSRKKPEVAPVEEPEVEVPEPEVEVPEPEVEVPVELKPKTKRKPKAKVISDKPQE